MNELPSQPKMRATTQAAEGVPRLRWTLAEFERLGELGLLAEDDRIELVGGELVPMAPKGNRHEVVCGAIHNWLRRNLPDDTDYHPEPGWRPDAVNYFEPDFVLGKRGFSRTTVPPEEVALLIEVAHSSLRFDTTAKANTYAALGVREYWVLNAQTLTTRVHRAPSAAGYANVVDLHKNEALVALLIPSLTLKVADLAIE